MISKIDPLHQINSLFHNHRNLVYLTLIILFGAALRIYNLGTESFWIDEIFTVYLIPQDLQTLVQQLATQGSLTRHAVYFLSAHFWVLPFGITEISIRSLSVLFGVLSIGMMYLVGQRLFGNKVGLISAFLIAVSEFQLYYSQTARFYSLFVLLTLLSVYFYIHWLKTNNPWFLTINLLFNILLFYTHTYAVFIFAVEYIHYFVYWKHYKNALFQWGLSQLLLLLAIVPSFITVIIDRKLSTSIGSGIEWITSPTLKDLLRTVYGYLFPQNYQHSWFFIGASFAAGLAFFILGAFFFNIRKVKKPWLAVLKSWFRNTRFLPHIANEFVLVVLWIAFPVILPFIYSIIFTPVFLDRYTICAAPAFYLLIATAISRISRAVPIYISLIALMIVVLPGLQDYYTAPVNEQWREAAAYVQKNDKADDVIVFAPDEEGFQHKSFDWYYHGNLLGCGISSATRNDQEIANALSNCTVGHERFWVIIRGTPEDVNRMKSFFLNPIQTAIHLIKEQQFVGISVYLFELTK